MSISFLFWSNITSKPLRSSPKPTWKEWTLEQFFLLLWIIGSNSKQQQAQSSYISNFEQQNQQLQQLQQYISSQTNNEKQQQQQHYNSQLSSTSNGSSSNINGYAGFYEHPHSSNKRSSPAKRELGIVEKLVGSYGFVKCLEREGRLFFHYSSFQLDQQQASNPELGLIIGDLVEFEEG